jgi:hypothetical protein
LSKVKFINNKAVKYRVLQVGSLLLAISITYGIVNDYQVGEYQVHADDHPAMVIESVQDSNNKVYNYDKEVQEEAEPVSDADEKYEEMQDMIDKNSDELLEYSKEVLDEYDVELPDSVEKDCIKVGNIYNICPEFLEAIAWRETRFDHTLYNGSCTGIMQVSSVWHQERMKRLGVSSLTDQYGCILVASDYLSELFDKYEDPGVVLMVYNGDSSYDSGTLSKYASEILLISESLERVHGK